MTLEFRLLLACARVLPSQADAAAIREMLFDGIDWTGFARMATEHGLAALAGRILNCVTPDMMPDEIRDAFRVNVDQTRQKNRALFADLSRVIEALADNRVEALPFKGPVLAFRAYGDLGLACSETRTFSFAIRTLRGPWRHWEGWDMSARNN